MTLTPQARAYFYWLDYLSFWFPDGDRKILRAMAQEAANETVV